MRSVSSSASAPTTAAASGTEDGLRRLRIYTKTGDKGSSSLYDGSRRSKDDHVFHALGTTDELNASIGLAVALISLQRRQQKRPQNSADAPRIDALLKQLALTQSRLLDLGSSIATPLPSSDDTAAAAARKGEKLQRVAFSPRHVSMLETWIDEWETQLPPLRNFILPGGGLASAQLHVARTICRRAEREVVPLVRENTAPPVVGIFINRLSDYLFVAARIACRIADGQPDDVIWHKDDSHIHDAEDSSSSEKLSSSVRSE